MQTVITGTKEDKPNQQVAKVDYRLRTQDSQWKVIDFTIESHCDVSASARDAAQGLSVLVAAVRVPAVDADVQAPVILLRERPTLPVPADDQLVEACPRHAKRRGEPVALPCPAVPYLDV